MQIVRLMGGFANQMREYVYGRYLEYRTGEPVYYDDNWFFRNKLHNGYELQRVYGMNLPLISQIIPKMIYKEILKDGGRLFQVLYNAGMDIDLILADVSQDITFTGKTIIFDKNTAFDNVDNSRYHFTYAGEFEEYYKEIKDIIDREFIFPPFPDDNCKKIANEIASCNSVGIHIRMGDFEKNGWLSAPRYYKKCIEWTEENISPDKYYIFSDGQEYCQKHMVEYGFDFVKNKLRFVDGNRGLHDYIDFQLMTLCSHLVVSRYSSFSQCACVFNKRLQTKINWDTIGMNTNEFHGYKREG